LPALDELQTFAQSAVRMFARSPPIIDREPIDLSILHDDDRDF
jgi:hypothetical protein